MLTVKGHNIGIFKEFCNTVLNPTECNLDVVSHLQKAYIARIDFASSSSGNCLDFFISTAVLL